MLKAETWRWDAGGAWEAGGEGGAEEPGGAEEAGRAGEAFILYHNLLMLLFLSESKLLVILSLIYAIFIWLASQ